MLSLEISTKSHPFNGQAQIYKRLARFVNLKSLTFRCQSSDQPARMFYPQSDNLLMSLESGLSQLEGLKQMRVLTVGPQTDVGKEEAKWMAKNWPRLCKVRGLVFDNESHDEAAKWFKTECPHIIAVAK